MIKVSTVRQLLEETFKKNGWDYTYLNQKNKNIPVPTYILTLRVINSKTKKIEVKIPVMISIFRSPSLIFFEALNIYKANAKNHYKILKIINFLNQYSIPGRFFTDSGKHVSYRCMIDYSNKDALDTLSIIKIINSIPPAYYMFLDELKKGDTNGK